MTLLRQDRAAAPRTLVDIFEETVAAHPDVPAVDNGAEVLTYAELAAAAADVSDALAAVGIGRGDRVGVRIASGSVELYVAILGVLLSGAAYVPVDADDPDERARTVFDEAAVAAVIGAAVTITTHTGGLRPAVAVTAPSTRDDAWIIFTSGSTGTPKGVAVQHRSAAGFVDAEARLFLQHRPIGPGDRVMAGLSVAFDASCEEMWLAWRYGACLVPAPRSLVRSGMDLGPWLVANEVTVVSTVPTLVMLWPVEALTKVRLLILGGEACPPEIGARLATKSREVWNTYGPTEATVVACAARLTGTPPVRIGLPLDGWDLAVVDPAGEPVDPGETGELIIGGIGLARYLDPEKDADKYAPMPTLGWERAYRSGDIVRYDEEGLVFVGRADEQVKIGGRRIELGELDSALLNLRGVTGAAAAVRTTKAGNKLLVGYVAVEETFEAASATQQLRAELPAALVPRIAVVASLPTKTSGKVDRDALPWPVEAGPSGPRARTGGRDGTSAWVAELWSDILGVDPDDTADFFELGGGSLTAAQLVGRLRQRYPEATVADVYRHPTLRRLSSALDAMAVPSSRTNLRVHPVPLKTQSAQVAATLPLRTLTGVRWLVWIGAAANVGAAALDAVWLPTVSWWWVLLGWLSLVWAPGRMALTALGARMILHGLQPGEYPRGGKVHLRLWLAERLADELGAANLAGAAWMPYYARALGASIGKEVDLHSIPPVTGFLTMGSRSSVEPEVDLRGHWLDGGVVRIGRVDLGAGSRVGARSTLAPGAHVGRGAEIGAGSAVLGHVPAGEAWSGAPAVHAGPARGPWEDSRPPHRPRWVVAYAAIAGVIALLPMAVFAVVALACLPWLREAGSLAEGVSTALVLLPAAVVVAALALTLAVWLLVRLLSLGLEEGHHPVHSRQAWQAWAVLRVLDEARTWLFPLYSSWLTAAWLRALGARIGKDVEASTVLLIPKLTSVGDGAFLADDTLLGGYELGGGWLRVGRVKIGKQAFVGNSGMAAPGRKVPKSGLVAVLSAAPRRTKAKVGTSWIGSPPTELRRESGTADASRTYHPTRRLRLARSMVELLRLAPVLVHFAIGLGVVTVLLLVAGRAGWLVAAGLSGGLLLVAGAVAAAVTAAAKWLLVGRFKPGDHPLWTSFVWRTELADTFVECVAAPWFARAATGTPVLNLWLRLLGARVGRGVWCETYWLPEADLVELADGATVNEGCVVQTHLFHDRMLSMDTVRLGRGATLGPHSVILPAAALGPHATVGPVSLVMRGESVPPKTRWIGNPIGPWVDEEPQDGPA